MGAVYRAADTKLNREVAIKVLPDSFVHDVDRVARFNREAHVLASLNHPNIAAIYGIEQGAIVMELVDGADLKGPVPTQGMPAKKIDELIAYGDRSRFVTSVRVPVAGGIRQTNSGWRVTY